MLSRPPESIPVDEPLERCGLSSRDAVALSGDLEEWLGTDVSPTLAWEYPTIEKIAAHLASASDEGARAAGRRAGDGDLGAREGAIAVVGMACRLPGSPDVAALWDNVIAGASCITPVPRERWDVDALFDAALSKPGTVSTRWGGFIEGIDGFDNEFFSISRREAARMDPQQRLLLEVAWETLESAHIPANALRGSNTGVFIGISSSDYSFLACGGVSDVDAYTGTGNAHSIAANRLSYLFDLQGPSLAVDTACSSSLVALHLACQSLRLEECDGALVGGVNLLITPHLFAAFSRAGMMSADGACKTFDERADGYVRSEGCGMVLLKRLADAQRDGDHVLAVIRGSAVNQDGLTNGLTAPNGLSQQRVLRAALKSAGVTPDDIGLIEAHGTGTPLGDPIEVDALKAVLGAGNLERPCYVGSLKTVLGHLEAAAGIAGILKAVLCLQHRRIPPHANFTRLNPRIRLEGTRLSIPAVALDWSAGGALRRAGVSSFGFGGTNAHVILEEYPRTDERSRPARAPRAYVLPLSAKIDEALVASATELAAFLERDATVSPASLCVAYGAGRTAFGRRAGVVFSETAALPAVLRELATKGRHDLAVRATATESPRLAFLFTGQGAQYAGMARELYETEPVFRAHLDACHEILRPHMEAPLLDVLQLGHHEAPTSIDDTANTQPALFAVEYSLFKLWEHWGVVPDAVAGHSVGEYAAACAAGVFSLEDGLKLVAARARLMQGLPAGGAMAAVAAGEETVAPLLLPFEGRVAVAAVNGPDSVVISGAREAVDSVVHTCRSRGLRCTPLNVSHAFHSPLLDPILEDFRALARTVELRAPSIPIVSNVTGALADGALMSSGEYWTDHMRRPVRFHDGVRALIDGGHRLFLEIGPHAVLTAMAEASCTEAGCEFIPSLRKSESNGSSLARAAASLFAAGRTLDWRRFAGEARAPRDLRLPSYPFQRRRCWIESTPAPAYTAALPARHGLEWREVASVDGGAQADAAGLGMVVLVSTDDSDAAELAASLRARGCRVVTVRSAGAIRAHADGATAVQAPADALPRALGAAADRGAQPVSIIYVAGAAGGGEGPPERAFVADATAACLTLADLVKAVAGLRAEGGARLFCVTTGAVPAGDVRVSGDLSHSALWGMGKAVALEHPEIWGGLIDLDVNGADRGPGLLASLRLAADEDQLAVRGRSVLACRLVERAASPVESRALHRDGTYLITGGLGGIGLTIADWIARNGGGHVVLTGRSALPDRATWGSPHHDPETQRRLAAIAEIERAGATVAYAQVNVGDRAGLQRLLEEIDAGPHPLRGVVHAAGVATTAPVSALTPADFAAMFEPKVAGGWLLHELTRSRPLDFMMFCSSTSAVLGSSFLAHYAAANAFLDALAHHRRAEGLPALGVNWGAWSDVGMTSPQDLERLAAMGMKGMRPAAAVRSMAAAMAARDTQVVIADIEWKDFLPVFEARRSSALLKELATRVAEPLAGEAEPAVPALPALSVRGLTVEAARAAVVAALRVEAAAVLHLDDASAIGDRRGFFEMGMDSLMAIELKKRVERVVGMTLPRTIAFECPNVATLADEVVRLLLRDADRDAPSVNAGEGRAPSELALTHENAEAVLLRELETLNY
jgi:acyl transferase domain-containing protein/acyl carrier protein